MTLRKASGELPTGVEAALSRLEAGLDHDTFWRVLPLLAEPVHGAPESLAAEPPRG